ncbi:LodA/GoxA family CTQ-dependent oxidase [Pseudophaeobacter leonis]|uniref:LodA/GoxA family CTQ-dependent oxidase n=1 Tax=Pseudophaeobacter leonis TaxID=1144477 RepID=UPI0009F1C5F6|nr:LodA/GoxA family CTQ-dependent oxidase [Pseudophaeobacter leonis]
MSKTHKNSKSANDVMCWNCQDHPIERLEEMFVTLIQGQRIARGQTPALRTVFLKQHGVAWGFFEPLKDLSDDLRVGVFGQGDKPVWVRFSSDTQPGSPDLHSTLGIGIKLFGVTGGTLMGEADTADFILQNHDVFFVDNAAEMCAFTTAGVVDGDYPGYLAKHRKTAHILNEMEKAEASCLTADYWAILPFAFGERFVKYRLRPVEQEAGEPFDNRNYLGLDLASRMRRGEALFSFEIQFRKGEEPLDEATVRWSGDWLPVAHLRLPQQDIARRGQEDYGQHLAFNIWRTPEPNMPQGSIAEARRVVYQGSADQRRQANGIPLEEPQNPATHSKPIPSDNCVVSAAIYPPVGVMRVGNSEQWYLGPEVPDPLPLPNGAYRDSDGHLKREAARFRVYGLNALGEAVCELNLDDPDTEIEWTVQIENQKSSWYEFQLALDIPEAADAPPSMLRNAEVPDRQSLRITPKRRNISGKDESGQKYHFDDGKFLGNKVPLGEVRTDESGRLIVLGGFGVAQNPAGGKAVTFANNDGWHDDTSDGPVKAKVRYKGVDLRVKPAWVICAPPNYGPSQKSVRTMWDLMRDVACDHGMLAKPARPSFTHDILPIFERMTNLQWVNAGFAAGFGFDGVFDFSTPQWRQRLGDPSPAMIERRRVLANNFRSFVIDGKSPVPWPWLYGDAMNIPPADTPRQHSVLSDFQMWALEQWVVGDFDADYDVDYVPPGALEDVPVADQPDTLTRAAMEFCLADAFHPGCEMTWPMRQAGMYMEAFRVKHRHKENPEPSYGAQLGDDWSLPDGPINGGQEPGGLTRWMAVPWQTDTSSCRSGYTPQYDPYAPTFWPARVPNEVMSETEYRTVMDTSLPLSQRLQAFANRANWLEPLGLDKSYTHQINHMVHHFDKMGVVQVRPGPQNDPNFPNTMQVSDEEILPWKTANEPNPEATSVKGGAVQNEQEGVTTGTTDLSNIAKVRRFRG